jgi:hypothetical protein
MNRPLLRTLLCAACFVAPALASGQKLFKRTEPIEITITTGLAKLIRDRDSTDRVKHPAELAYKDSTGASVKLPVTLRTRGHFRRQARNCDFPPLKLELTKDAAKKTVFDGNRTLKLASNCRPPNTEYEQYILQEAVLFRMYTLITPWSYRVRLAHVTYQDSTGKTKPIASWAFLVEDVNDLAQRRNTKPIVQKGARFDDLELETWGYAELFQYMIGNTDWSVSGLHNITLLKDSIGTVVGVPYDFDWSGAVSARYAVPNSQLPIHNVQDRLWRGDCRSVEELTPLLDHFKQKRPALDSTYLNLEPLAPAVKERMRKYFQEFWTFIDNPKRVAAEFKRSCGSGN